MKENMEPYFAHLMDDIRLSYTNMVPNTSFQVYPVSIFPNNLPDQWQNTPVYPEKTIGEWIKLDPEAFPPADRWEEKHLKDLCSSLRQLFNFYRYEPVLPWTLSLAIEYTWLLKGMSKISECFASQEDVANIVPIHFCQEDPDDCPFSSECLLRADIGCESIDKSIGWERYL